MKTKYDASKKEITCYCGGVLYPHRIESLKSCRDFHNNQNNYGELLLDFDRAEARAINLENQRVSND